MRCINQKGSSRSSQRDFRWEGLLLLTADLSLIARDGRSADKGVTKRHVANVSFSQNLNMCCSARKPLTMKRALPHQLTWIASVKM